ncbi:MAG: histidine triad nucleotide-binding protein [Cyanobacteria bacterium SZAS LIN-3]|nr:histidine triad nucleotide-binding protein [Cyanobacteria bacterium SZAS LIN-3]MBS2008175.1 histidine triad nucleotide-binding protein [Cyanobacteria bacterium SZAS TMP-1]
MSSEKSQPQQDQAPAKQANCLFCSIHNKEIKANFVYEDEDAFAIRDINPQAPTHILVIPRRHVDNVKKLEDKNLIGSLFYAAARVAEQENLDGGFRLVVNTGDDGGQTVNHLHIHVLGGRSLVWPPG